MSEALGGHLPPKSLALFKILNSICKGAVRRHLSIKMLSPVNLGHISAVHGLVTMQQSDNAQAFTMIDTGRTPHTLPSDSPLMGLALGSPSLRVSR